jgi:hypothetical protein
MKARFVKNALLMGIPFGFFMDLFFGWIHPNGYELYGGLFCGLFFGVLMSSFAEIQFQRLQSKDGLFEGETILLEGPVNHFLRLEGRGGWLTLTGSRLAFRSHGKNIQNAPLNLPLDEIQEVKTSRTMGLFPNGLKVRKKDGIWETFGIANRNEWVKRITSLRNS